MMLLDRLECDIDKEELLTILLIRLKNFFFISKDEEDLIRKYHEDILIRLETCFLGVDNKYFHKNGKAYFSYCHSGQYLIYLYFYSRKFADLKHSLKDKFYYLNKVMHGVDIYSEIELPSVFFFEHPLGLVLGRAVYGENFFAMQGCTVGGNKEVYPKMGKNIKMFSDSKVLGNCTIGDNVWISANTYIKDEDVPANTIVFGSSPNLVFKKLK